MKGSDVRGLSKTLSAVFIVIILVVAVFAVGLALNKAGIVGKVTEGNSESKPPPPAPRYCVGEGEEIKYRVENNIEYMFKCRYDECSDSPKGWSDAYYKTVYMDQNIKMRYKCRPPSNTCCKKERECDDHFDCEDHNYCEDGECNEGCLNDDSKCFPPTPYCTILDDSPNSWKCVECKFPQHCPDGQKCVDFSCVPGCSSDADCEEPTPACLQSLSKCVRCTGSQHCPESKPICKDYTYCIECETDNDCDSDEICDHGEYECIPKPLDDRVCCIYDAPFGAINCEYVLDECRRENFVNEHRGPCEDIPVCNSDLDCDSPREKCTDTRSELSWICCLPGECDHFTSGRPICNVSP